MVVNKKIAVLCNYELLPNRIGGMDYFFWLFDAKCKENNVQVDWYFPNSATFREYHKLNIIVSSFENVEQFFYEFNLNNNNKYSFVITHFVELCTPILKKIKKLGNPKIIQIDHNPRPIEGYTFRKKIEKKVKGYLYSKNVHSFIGVSVYTVNEIIKDFGIHIAGKTRTIYNGVLINEIQERITRIQKKPTFLVASHLRESKGIQDLIEAVNILPEEIKAEIRIDVYGDGPFKNNLLEKVNFYKLNDSIIFKGSVNNLNQIYFLYDYLIHPTYMECFSLAILESLAANVPVITTNVGGNEEAIKHQENGFIFTPKDILKLSGYLERLYLGIDFIKGNTRNQIEENFSIENMVQNHFQLIK